MNSLEVWKPVKGYEGFYEVSNFGNVRSLDRYVEQKQHSGTMFKRLYKGKLLKPRKTNSGYFLVTLKSKQVLVHRLVATAFIPNPDNKPCVNHIDSCRTNNHANNLEWVTQSENVQHGIKNGRYIRSEEFKNKLSKAMKDKYSKETHPMIGKHRKYISENKFTYV